MKAFDEDAALKEMQATLRAAGKMHTVTKDTRVLKDLGFDSVGALDFIMALETRLDIVIPMERMAAIVTAGDLARVLVEQTGKRPSDNA